MTTDVRQVNLDLTRESRLGFDEAIFCEQKSVQQIDSIIGQGLSNDTSMLLTRLKPEVWQPLKKRWGERVNYCEVSQTAFFNWRPRPTEERAIAVVTAGTSDAPVAREAVRTLNYYGEGVDEYYDVGVAGLWRLLDRVDELRKHPVLIAVAGMDAALPSVLGGLVGSMIVAVPTSTGYGATNGGQTALNAALVSCAPGILVCNIDNGYGAACAALRATRSLRR